ncbi:hypothetical protein PCC6912_14300 [Chlorogloeopsis fritschii PCC 6912]|uniref:Uncharacterized protein n=1 Tax=Chlorogloeopsis fritschii PCC 6912 TaxID=211165 RepID=A0A3S5K2C4_CHLFR|nr:hypothetical protein PCC6912_14300 [Chlorogloeopsis fritschii PCC 6912]
MPNRGMKFKNQAFKTLTLCDSATPRETNSYCDSATPKKEPQLGSFKSFKTDNKY